MTNRFYNTTFTALPLTLIRSAAANGQFALVDAGFVSVQGELDGQLAEIVAGRQGQASLAANFALKVPYSGLTQNLPAGGYRITGLGTPSASADAVTKSYADGLAFATVLPAQTGNAGKFVTTDGTTASWAYPNLALNVVTGTTQTAAAGNHYVLTNVAATTVTLPATPTAGDVVWVTVGNGLTTNVIARNGNNIQSLAEDCTLNANYAAVQLRYINSTIGWTFV